MAGITGIEDSEEYEYLYNLLGETVVFFLFLTLTNTDQIFGVVVFFFFFLRTRYFFHVY